MSTPSPVTWAYDQTGENQWTNRNSGDVVVWSPEQGIYQFLRHETGDWSWWGLSKQNTWIWHAYQRTAADRRNAGLAGAHFWINTLVGLIFLIAAGVNGYAPVGALILVFFMIWGGLLALARLHHPGLDTAIIATGAVGAILHHHNHQK